MKEAISRLRNVCVLLVLFIDTTVPFFFFFFFVWSLIWSRGEQKIPSPFAVCFHICFSMMVIIHTFTSLSTFDFLDRPQLLIVCLFAVRPRPFGSFNVLDCISSMTGAITRDAKAPSLRSMRSYRSLSAKAEAKNV